ncbi:MAG: hypothetical protein Q9194_007059, partial [Teloschistes cf. exilis]
EEQLEKEENEEDKEMGNKREKDEMEGEEEEDWKPHSTTTARSWVLPFHELGME